MGQGRVSGARPGAVCNLVRARMKSGTWLQVPNIPFTSIPQTSYQYLYTTWCLSRFSYPSTNIIVRNDDSSIDVRVNNIKSECVEGDDYLSKSMRNVQVYVYSYEI